MKRSFRLPAVLVAAAITSLAAGGYHTAASGERVTVTALTIGYPDADQVDAVSGANVPGIGHLEEAFEAANPTIDLEIVNIQWGDGATSYSAKTEAMIQANQACVYEMPGVLDYARRGMLLELDPLIEADAEFENVWGEGLDIARTWGPNRPDTLWYLPENTGIRVTHWDAKLFDDFGVEPLSAIPTLDEIKEKAAALTGTNPVTGEETFGYWYQGKYAVWQFMAIAHAMGASWGEINEDGSLSINWQTPEFEAALQWFVDMTEYAPRGALGADAMPPGFLTDDNNVAIIPEGESGYFINAQTTNPELAERFRTSQNVKGEDGLGGLNAFSPIAIAKSCETPAEAWTVAKWMAGANEAQRYYFESIGRLPSTVNGAEIVPEIAELPDGDNIFAQAITPEPVYPWASTEPRWAMQAALEGALAGQLTPAEALAQAQEETDAWLAEQA